MGLENPWTERLVVKNVLPATSRIDSSAGAHGNSIWPPSITNLCRMHNGWSAGASMISAGWGEHKLAGA